MSERIAFRYAPTGLLFGSEEDKRTAPPTTRARVSRCRRPDSA